MKPLAPIRTARLTLRPLREDDRQAVVRILSCSITMERVLTGPLSVEAAGAWLDRRIADEAEHGYSMWGIEHLRRGDSQTALERVSFLSRHLSELPIRPGATSPAMRRYRTIVQVQRSAKQGLR